MFQYAFVGVGRGGVTSKGLLKVAVSSGSACTSISQTKSCAGKSDGFGFRFGEEGIRYVSA